MKAKSLLVTGSVMLILVGGFILSGAIAMESMTFAAYGGMLLLTGILGIYGALFSKHKKAGYFFVIMGVVIWLPIILTVTAIADAGGEAGLAAACFGLPALIVTILWCASGLKNITPEA